MPLDREVFFNLIKSFGITINQFAVLDIVNNTEKKRIPLLQIGEKLRSGKSDITRIVDRLEKLGLLKRARNKKDRRVVFAKLTKSGLELLEEIEPLLNEIHRVHFSNLSKEELKEFNNMLIKNIEHTEKEKLTANRLL